jgi:hypothetical protein
MRFSDYEYDYMIPRPDGSIIVGGGRRDYYHDLNKWFGNSDDGSLIEGAETYFDGYMQRHFHGWEDCDVRTEDLWTGSESRSLLSSISLYMLTTLLCFKSWATPTTASLMLDPSATSWANTFVQDSTVMACRRSSSRPKRLQ